MIDVILQLQTLFNKMLFWVTFTNNLEQFKNPSLLMWRIFSTTPLEIAIFYDRSVQYAANFIFTTLLSATIRSTLLIELSKNSHHKGNFFCSPAHLIGSVVI